MTERFPDERTGDITYTMADAALGAFSAFFTQSPSFLDFQRTLQVAKGCNNALTLFGIEQIPTDNQIRNLLDPVPPSAVFSVFSYAVDAMHELGHLEAYRSINWESIGGHGWDPVLLFRQNPLLPVQHYRAFERYDQLLSHR
ncbi:MAG: hypothetical protein GY794_22525, partial [bacterium]|nr:hypothetical protein [bacterium]